jgi:hypothetical protein
MGENRDEYRGKRKVNGVVCPKTEKWLCPVRVVFIIWDKETI